MPLLINGRFPIGKEGKRPSIWEIREDPLRLATMIENSLDPQLFARAYRDGVAVIPTAFELATFKTWIDVEFNALPCEVKFWSGDISLSECRAEFIKSGALNVSTANSSHPFLTDHQNARFRAVHDWHHLETGADDSLNGEHSTFCHAAAIAPHSITWILFSEIVLQAAAYIYFGEFQAQKLVKVGGF